MKRWLAILLPLSLLGQAPRTGGTEPVSRLPETDELDPATREYRDALEAQRDDAETLATPEVTPPLLSEPAAADASASPQELGGFGPEVTEPDMGVGGSGTAPAGAPAGTPATGGTGTAQGTAPTGTSARQAPAGTVPESTRRDAPPTPEQLARQVQQLQTQVRTLQQQLQAREEQITQNTERTASLQQDMGAFQARSAELERLRQLRLAQLQSAWEWMLAADTALETGELAVDTALRQADLSLGDALENAAGTGQGETVLHMQSARELVASARERVDNRDVYNARVALQTAGQHLARARALALSQPDVSLAAPPAAQAPATGP